MDKDIESKARNLLDSGKAELVSNLMTVELGESHNITLPCEIRLQITIEGIRIFDSTSKELLLSSPLGESFPVVVINKLSNSLYELHLAQDKVLQVLAKDNIERDIIAVAIRMFCGKKILLGNLDNSHDEDSHKEVFRNFYYNF